MDLTEEALWEGVLLPALLPACSLRSVFFSGRWPGPVGSFRSTAPHHNPPFLELAIGDDLVALSSNEIV